MNPGPYSDQYPDEYSPQNSAYSASSGSSPSSASSGDGASSANEDVGSLSYERAREELVAVVQRLEAGSVPLEDSLALWERGEALAGARPGSTMPAPAWPLSLRTSPRTDRHDPPGSAAPGRARARPRDEGTGAPAGSGALIGRHREPEQEPEGSRGCPNL